MIDGGPAFPNNDQNGCAFAGMTLRDWFAGMALPGVINKGGLFDSDEVPRNEIAEYCYRMADAMLAAREGKQTETN